MQHPWLAAMARSVGTTPSRRTALTTLLGGLPGLLLTAGIAEGNGKKGKHKKPSRKKRPCRANDKPGKTCRCRKAGGRCTADANCCPRTKHRSCQDGICQPCDVCQKGCAFSSVQAAIDAAAPGDTIRLCSGIFAERIQILKDLTLIGAGDGAGGTALDGRGIGPVVTVNNGPTVTLEGMCITGGRSPGSGGGVLSANESTLTLRACTVSGNEAVDRGGGIFDVDGRLTLQDSTVADNEAADGGGLFCDGGSETTLSNSTVRGNVADREGGGIFLFSVALTLTNSRVEGNTARAAGGSGGAGGGISNFIGTVTLQDSVVTNNTPDNCAGEVPGCG